MGTNMKKRWVIKLGTGILTRQDGQLDAAQFSQLSEQVVKLAKSGYEIVLVSSGAVGAGMKAMSLEKRPKVLSELQACATVGQIQMMMEYQKRFVRHGFCASQLLLTYWDLDSRSCYENARKTIELLLSKKRFIPVINENDAISGEEIKFGDNDKLSAHVAVMVKATRLVILSNIDGLMSSLDENGKIISVVKKDNKNIKNLAVGTNSERSVGGMVTKLEAARIAGNQGIETVIANGRKKTILAEIAKGKFLGTRFLAS